MIVVVTVCSGERWDGVLIVNPRRAQEPAAGCFKWRKWERELISGATKRRKLKLRGSVYSVYFVYSVYSVYSVYWLPFHLEIFPPVTCHSYL